MNSKKSLIILRAWLFLLFSETTYAKHFTANSTTVQIETFIGHYATTHAYVWYRGFLEGFVMHHVTLFAILVATGELYICVAMLLGITTRLAAGVAVFLLLNYWAAKGAPRIIQSDMLDAMVCLILIVEPAGRWLGVDRFLHQRYPKIPIW